MGKVAEPQALTDGVWFFPSGRTAEPLHRVRCRGSCLFLTQAESLLRLFLQPQAHKLLCRSLIFLHQFDQQCRKPCLHRFIFYGLQLLRVFFQIIQ